MAFMNGDNKSLAHSTPINVVDYSLVNASQTFARGESAGFREFSAA